MKFVITLINNREYFITISKLVQQEKILRVTNESSARAALCSMPDFLPATDVETGEKLTINKNHIVTMKIAKEEQ